MKKKKKETKLGNKIIKGLLGLGLVIFAVVPTPDDITIISPVLAFTFGTKLIVDTFR